LAPPGRRPHRSAMFLEEFGARSRAGGRQRRSIPSKSDFLELAAAEALVALPHGTSPALPVEIARGGIVGQRPDDEPAQLARIEMVAACLEQALAETHALMRRFDVDLVDLAFVSAPHARRAER